MTERVPPLRRLAIAFSALLGLVAGARAALPVGAQAPEFTAEAAVGGKSFTFDLKQALAKGPVVLYFYPKSFTSGCTIEAHNFADAAPTFASLGATLIGMSKDDIATQKDFSSRECRDRFAVAADPDGRVIGQFGVGMALFGGYADRISYVIAPDGRIAYVYSSMSPDRHVENTLAAVRALKAPAH
jgi:peroxiredoxin